MVGLISLTDELIDLIISALPLHHLLPLRASCSHLSNRVQRRFLPIVSPPDWDKDNAQTWTERKPVSPARLHDAQAMMRVYAQYLKWLRRWWDLHDEAHPPRGPQITAKLCQLRKMSSPIDGYFALAPWWRAYGELVPDNWAPEQWVHEALYESPGAIPANPRPQPQPATANATQPNA